jgi:transcriptional regulator with GAF, ATPase, and Fis domain
MSAAIEAGMQPTFDVLDPPMRTLVDLVDRVAPTHLTVLLLGETGTGKDVLAERLHARSSRVHAPFLKVNSAGLSESLVESELFGHERGAFTGALAARTGFFEAADGGTLFLDEIGELSPRVQAKLLRVLEHGEVVRVGSTQPRHVDVRILAATHRDLRQLVARGEFREDLCFRLSGLVVRVPPLRERRSEILPLAEHFADVAARRLGLARPALTPAAAEALLRHDWPGNVRELRQAMERAIVMRPSGAIEPCDLCLAPVDVELRLRAPAPFPSVSTFAPTPSAARARPPEGLAAIRDEVRVFEKERILRALAQTAGNQTRAAELLGVSRRTLTTKLGTYGIDRPRKRAVGEG